MIEVIFLDMDNTIAENTTPMNVTFIPGMYLGKRPIKQVLQALDTLYPDTPRVIVSKVQGGVQGIKEKKEWLQNKEVKNIIDYIFLKEDEQYWMKGVYIDQWLSHRQIPNSKCLVIDDNKQVLQYCQAYGLLVQYPQQVLCDLTTYNEEFIERSRRR